MWNYQYFAACEQIWICRSFALILSWWWNAMPFTRFISLALGNMVFPQNFQFVYLWTHTHNRFIFYSDWQYELSPCANTFLCRFTLIFFWTMENGIFEIFIKPTNKYITWTFQWKSTFAAVHKFSFVDGNRSSKLECWIFNVWKYFIVFSFQKLNSNLFTHTCTPFYCQQKNNT